MFYFVCTNIWTGMIRTDQCNGGIKVLHPTCWRMQRSDASSILLSLTNPELTSVCFNGIALSIIHYTINNKIVVENIMLEWNRTDLTPHLQCSVCLQINIFTLHVSNTTGNTGNPPPAPAPSLDSYVCNCIFTIYTAAASPRLHWPGVTC